MTVYRIVKNKNRVNDLSGTGAFRAGGRWNNKGTYLLYTSSNSSLAYLENLVYFDAGTMPGHLYILELQMADDALIYTLPDSGYPKNWKQVGNVATKLLGDQWIAENKFIGFKVKSAINELEYNYLLNPLFPGFQNLVKITTSTLIKVDDRLIRQTGVE